MNKTVVQRLYDASEGYPAMLQAIANAKQRVWLANYCQIDDIAYLPFQQALLAAAERGCDVRVLVDSYGSSAPDLKQAHALRAVGAHVTHFNAYSFQLWRFNKRLHKKILLVDDAVGFTGGLGIAAFWQQPTVKYPLAWRDTHFKLTGPALNLLEQGFASSWNKFAHDKVVVQPGPAEPGISLIDSQPLVRKARITKLLVDTINSAEHSLDMTTAYFGPIKPVGLALARAAKRGVTVRVICNGPHSTHPIAQRAGSAQYDKLAAAGVQLYEYQPTKIHAKLCVVDNSLSLIGSANLNSRSAQHDEELCLRIENKDLAQQLTSDFEADLANCQVVGKLSWSKKLNARLAALLSYYF